MNNRSKKHPYIIIGILLIIILAISIKIFSNNKKPSYIMEGARLETSIYYIDNNKDLDVLIIAGIHGNEVGGIMAADRIIEEAFDWANFIIIPRANMEAVNLGVRNPYYMSDLNRAFPGKNPGTETEELADDIYRFIEDLRPDFIIDLHEWDRKFDEDGTYYSHGLIVSTKDMEFWKSLEKVYNEYREMDFDLKLMLEVGNIDGTFNKEISNGLNVPVVTVESNMNEKIEDRIDFHLYIIESIIKNQGMD